MLLLFIQLTMIDYNWILYSRFRRKCYHSNYQFIIIIMQIWTLWVFVGNIQIKGFSKSNSIVPKACRLSGVTAGGQSAPDTSHRESADLEEKERTGKKGKWRRKEGKSIKERWKREGGKVTKWGEDLQIHWNLFWVNQNGNFLPGKAFHAGEKIRKNDFPPLKNFPLTPLCRLIAFLTALIFRNLI